MAILTAFFFTMFAQSQSVQTMFYVGAWKEAHQRLRRTKIELVNEEEKNRPSRGRRRCLSFIQNSHSRSLLLIILHLLSNLTRTNSINSSFAHRCCRFLSLEWIESKMTQSWVLFFWRIVQSSSQSVKCFIPIRLDRQWQQQRQLKTGTINCTTRSGWACAHKL